MKTMASKIGEGAALSVALLLLGSLAPRAQAQTTPPSPVGTWDLVVSSVQRGVAQITFVDDGGGNGGSLTGVELNTFSPRKTSTPTRGPFFSGGRSPVPENTNAIPVTNFYGRGHLVGSW